MVLVTSYAHLRKRGPVETFRPFAPLRAVGLSLELGWKKARDAGLGAVTAEDLRRVHVTGELLVQGVAAQECDLQLRKADTDLVKTLLHKQRDLLDDLGFNVWYVDFWQPGCSKRLDLVGDFGPRRDFGVTGRVWVELKVFSDATFAKEVEHWKTQLEANLVTESGRDASLQAVLLLTARVPRISGGRWGAPALHAMLFVKGSQQWLGLAGAQRAARGQSRVPSHLLRRFGARWSGIRQSVAREWGC